MERRDKTALHPIISRCVRPGAEVHSDDWASYRQMDRKVNNVSAQQVVVHRLNFVNPVTGVHTQEIESYWNSWKLGQKTRRGIRREDMLSYLDEQMWRQWRAGTPQQAMQNFLAVLANRYLINNLFF